jgi:hypothetical protein
MSSSTPYSLRRRVRPWPTDHSLQQSAGGAVAGPAQLSSIIGSRANGTAHKAARPSAQLSGMLLSRDEAAIAANIRPSRRRSPARRTKHDVIDPTQSAK